MTCTHGCRQDSEDILAVGDVRDPDQRRRRLSLACGYVSHNGSFRAFKATVCIVVASVTVTTAAISSTSSTVCCRLIPDAEPMYRGVFTW